MQALRVQRIINLGEVGAPMNGIFWLASREWPLSGKMQRSDFIEFRIARLRHLRKLELQV